MQLGEMSIPKFARPALEHVLSNIEVFFGSLLLVTSGTIKDFLVGL